MATTRPPTKPSRSPTMTATTTCTKPSRSPTMTATTTCTKPSRFESARNLVGGTGAVALPFPGSRGLHFVPPRAPGRLAVGRLAGSENRKRAGALSVEAASEASVPEHRGARAGRCGDTSAPLEPPRADARCHRQQGGTERGRPLDDGGRRKHRRERPEWRERSERHTPGTRGAQRGPRVERAGAFDAVFSWLVPSQGERAGGFLPILVATVRGTVESDYCLDNPPKS
jgi:hypothetical protein